MAEDTICRLYLGDEVVDANGRLGTVVEASLRLAFIRWAREPDHVFGYSRFDLQIQPLPKVEL
jgi:hypothetical protein